MQMKLTKPDGAPPSEPEHLPCPRCESTNTKFCYYNNYNFSQPRHFCKGCRRYWTHGGTLRDIPIGGSTRKRHRSLSIDAASKSRAPTLPPPVVYPGEVKQGLNYGSFTSLLGSNGPGFNGFSGFGPGFVNPMWQFQMGNDGGGVMGNTWQMQSGENSGGECFVLPELAISTSGYCLK